MTRAEVWAEAMVERAELTGDDPPGLLVCVVDAGGGDPIEAAAALLTRLRDHTARSHVRALGRDEGYRIEDASAAAIAVPAGADAEKIRAWVRRRLGRDVEVVPSSGPLSLAVEIVGRVGRSPGRTHYEIGPDGRVHVEAFELHVAEHCNLRCANCCNMSPLVGERTLSVAEVDAIARRMAGVIRADVVKIMGGEPLLHPELPGVIRALRDSGVGERVRLFTNGLLLHTVGDDFWEALDELTISSYASAPVKPAMLDLARERAARHDFVLNIKRVHEFTQVLSPRLQHAPAKTKDTFDRCWLRHRCLVVRNGRFYACTRAAYAEEFDRRVLHEMSPEPVDRSGDGVAIDEPDLAPLLLAQLNRETPLVACRHCFGGDGESEPHYQLTRAEVALGVVSRRLALLP